jgi:sugar-specific transcriptional regulator TrmB
MENKSQLLHNLGLSPVQSKVYFTLLQFGQTTTQVLSEYLRIDRSDGYKALTKLRKMGLILEVISKPKRYEAIPVSTSNFDIA